MNEAHRGRCTSSKTDRQYLFRRTERRNVCSRHEAVVNSTVAVIESLVHDTYFNG